VERVEPAAEHLSRRLDDHDPHVVARVEPRPRVDQAGEEGVVDDAPAVGAVEAQPADRSVGDDRHTGEVIAGHDPGSYVGAGGGTVGRPGVLRRRALRRGPPGAPTAAWSSTRPSWW